ncbi:MAG: hypothetical protein ACRDU9_00240 [Acidimicrobiia bacterium]
MMEPSKPGGRDASSVRGRDSDTGQPGVPHALEELMSFVDGETGIEDGQQHLLLLLGPGRCGAQEPSLPGSFTMTVAHVEIGERIERLAVGVDEALGD